MSGNPATGPVPQSISVTNPAAGADISYAFLNHLEVTSVVMQLACAVAAANRLPKFQLTDASNNVLWESWSPQASTSGQTNDYVLHQGATMLTAAAIQANVVGAVPLPSGLVVASGWKLVTVTAALQAADQWQKIFILGQKLFT